MKRHKELLLNGEKRMQPPDYRKKIAIEHLKKPKIRIKRLIIASAKPFIAVVHYGFVILGIV